MAVSQSYATFVEEQLFKLDGAQMKKMFGGTGIFKEGTMFALVRAKEQLYLRTVESTKGKFEGNVMPYHEVPADVVEDFDKMAQWAEAAFETALQNKKKK